MPASWRPDPSGRHDYRWWTGVGWSDQVGDRGVVSIDPGPVPAAPAGSRERANYARRRWGALVGTLAVVGGFSLATLQVIADEASDGIGLESFDVGASRPLATHRIELAAGDVVRIRIEPPRSFAVEAAILVPEPAAREIAEALSARPDRFGGGDEPDAIFDRRFSSAAEVFGADLPDDLAGLVVIQTLRTITAGRPTTGWLAAYTGVDHLVVIEAIGPSESAEGRIVVERYGQRYDALRDDPTRFFAASFFTEAEFYVDRAPYVPG